MNVSQQLLRAVLALLALSAGGLAIAQDDVADIPSEKLQAGGVRVADARTVPSKPEPRWRQRRHRIQSRAPRLLFVNSSCDLPNPLVFTAEHTEITEQQMFIRFHVSLCLR